MPTFGENGAVGCTKLSVPGANDGAAGAEGNTLPAVTGAELVPDWASDWFAKVDIVKATANNVAAVLNRIYSPLNVFLGNLVTGEET